MRRDKSSRICAVARILPTGGALVASCANELDHDLLQCGLNDGLDRVSEASICLPRWPGSAAPLWANQVEDLVGVVADAEILG
jgi:hypothetical protein